jgi:hypothetical protein
MKTTKLLLTSLAFISFGAATEDACSTETRLNARQALAVSDALSRFKSDGRRLGAYSIFITSASETIDVTLVPDPIKAGPMGAEASEAPEINYFYDATGRAYLKQLRGK